MALKKGKICVQKNSGLENMSAEELQRALLNDNSLYRKVLSYASNIRSTPPYWFQKGNELKDFVEQVSF